MVLHISALVTAEDNTGQINTGKYYELLQDNQK
jgi:hypothetical protein